MVCLSFTSLLALVLGASLGAAFPHHALKKSCSLSKYQLPAPHERKAVQKMKQHFENILLPNRKCIKLFHRKLNPAELLVPDRMMLVEAELNLTIAMLGLPADPSFSGTRQQPMAFLTQAREDLRHCMATEAPLHQPSRKLRHWLQKLQTARETETTSCLEASAIIYIFEVLKDLQCVALREQCT
ncbi:interferon lambda-3-like [Pterocles gutturalis]